VNFSQPTPPYTKRGKKRRLFPVKSRVDPLQGTVILGQYRINSKLSQGGMSTVYLARNFDRGGLFAVKVLRRDYIRDPIVRERILNEFKAIQRIDHPAVVKIFEVGEIGDEQICLVMEYVHGSPLRRIVQGSPMRAAKVISIAAAVAEGLGAAHEQQIIHRDLKPENILLPRSGDSKTLVKIIDFGIARIIDTPSITTTQHIMGTPEYIAPEQALGQPVDHRADIYALGVLMYEMLSGKLPFTEEDPSVLLHHHIHTTPQPLSAFGAGGEVIPVALVDLVMACLSKEPWKRPRHLGEMLDVLSKI
jgi:serine/threonine protein kinase